MFTLDEIEHLEQDLLAQIIFVEVASPCPISLRDPDDEVILSSALEGGCDFLVTGDKDLLSVARDPRLGLLRIVTAADFLTTLD